MKKEIEKLCLSENQYRGLGLFMIVLCIFLCAMIFFFAEFSILLAIVYALIGIEFLIIGISFRIVANEISESDDREFLENHQYSRKSSKSRNTVVIFSLTLFLVCVISLFMTADFEISVYKKGENGLELSSVTVEQTGSKTVTKDKVETSNNANGIHSVVYATEKGKRYHYSASCAGENSFAITIEEAGKHSLTPCQKCVK